MRTLFVTGGAGYLGSEVASQARAAGWRVVAPSRSEADVRDERAIASAAAGADAIIHCAYRKGGDAEAWATNVDGSAIVARVAARTRARLVHLSTDLVFDGSTDGAYAEDDEAKPVLPYGETKLAAEREVLAAMPEALVVRTSILYGKEAPGPQERLVLDALDAGADVVFFDDEIRCATHVSDLAAALLELVDTNARGVLHVAGGEAVNRHELARAIAIALGRDPSRLRRGKTPSDRPRNCALDTTRAKGLLRTKMRGCRAASSGRAT